MGHITSLKTDMHKNLVVSMNKPHSEQKTQNLSCFLGKKSFTYTFSKTKSNDFLEFLNVTDIFYFVKCSLHYVQQNNFNENRS